MKTTCKRERDRARGENNIFCTQEQDFSLRGLWIFFFLLPSFFVVTDISPHFPGIKNPFWIIHSILNLAGTCIHNKLNLPRRFWDLSWMCQWHTTKILSFIFNTKATGRVTSSLISKAPRKNGQYFFFTHVTVFGHFPHCNADIIWILNMLFMSYRLWNGAMTLSHFIPKQRLLHWTATHDFHQNRERSASHFLMVTQAMRPGNWTVGGSLSVHHMTCLKSLKRSPFREARNMPDYFCRLYFSFSLQSQISPFCRKQLFFIQATRSLSAIVYKICPAHGVIS